MAESNFKIGWAFRWLHKIVMGIFVRYFRVGANITPEIEQHKGPYLLLCNHIASYDPFLVSYFLQHPPHFVSSDAIFKSPFLRFFLNGFGVIPKRKNVRDTQVIRDIVGVVRGGGSIGLFPEGSRTWSGETLHIEPSTAKLIKLLKIPVIVAKMKGVYWINPRWGFKVRRAAGEIDFSLVLTPDQIASMNTEEIMDGIQAALYHNEIAYQRKTRTKIESNHRAEHIGFLLYVCPHCESISSIKGIANEFECHNCEQKGVVDEFGFLQANHPDKWPYDNLFDWYNWERDWLEKYIHKAIADESNQPLFVDQNALLFQDQDQKMQPLGEGSAALYLDRILFVYDNGDKMEMLLQEVEALNPQFHERIEIFYKGKAYRITNKEPGVSGLKWEIAVNCIWSHFDQAHKVSTYMKRVENNKKGTEGMA